MGRCEHSPKVIAMYRAVAELFAEGADLNSLTVSEITSRAGIGKGTAYEYFSSKEEILAEALYYVMKNAAEDLYRNLERKDNLNQKVNEILIDMEQHMHEVVCAFKVLYIMMDNSVIGKKLRQLCHEKRDDEMLLFELIEKLIREELGEGIQLAEEDILYLVLNISSRLLAYALYLNTDAECRLHNCIKMREKLCEDICREVEGYR